jgi:hypothetical protein
MSGQQNQITKTFDAKAFYAGQRALGANPCVSQSPEGALGEHVAIGQAGGVTGDVTPFYDWARDGDSDWALRKAYAREVWDNRPASDLPTIYQFVQLGEVR